MKYIRFFPLFIFLLHTATCLYGQSVEDALKEANDSFTYKGEPIHPGLIREFEGFISDGQPITLTVDVIAAYGTNEYFDDTEEYQSEIIIRPSVGGYYSYKYLGTVSDKIHVVRTFENEGGNLTFSALMFLEFDTCKGFDYNGKLYDQLRMSVLKYYHITEGTNPEIMIKNKTVKIKYNDHTVLIEF